MNWKLVLIFLLTVSLLPLNPVFSKSNSQKKLFEIKCVECHSLEKSLNRRKTRKAWGRVVERMRIKRPSLFSEKEGREIASYLFSIKGKKVTASKSEKRRPQVIRKPKVISSEISKKSPSLSPHKFKSVAVEQFVEPGVCAGCHKDIFDQWSGSMHSQSFLDPLWRESTKLFASQAKSDDAKLEVRMCIKCHNPLGFRSGTITTPDKDFDNVPGLVKEGIFCNWCHNISEVKSIGDADYEVSPGNGVDDPSEMLGPFHDSVSSFHPSKYSQLHKMSEFCGLCHNVSHAANLTPIESTYDEWKNSPYHTGKLKTTVFCQDCHMRQTLTVPATGKTARPDNPGFACSSGPKRDHVPTHYIVGGNTIGGEGFGNEVHAKLATARLKNAADIEIVQSGVYRKGSMANFKVKVINSGAGHYLPTGMSELRQMWLDIKVIDKAGRLIFSSGDVDVDGRIDTNAVMFNTVLGDSDGNPVINIALADRVLYDHRIPPKGYVVENYSFFIPGYISDTIQVKALLRYRSCSQEFSDVVMKEKSPAIPIVDMAQAVLDIGT